MTVVVDFQARFDYICFYYSGICDLLREAVVPHNPKNRLAAPATPPHLAPLLLYFILLPLPQILLNLTHIATAPTYPHTTVYVGIPVRQPRPLLLDAVVFFEILLILE